MSTGYPKYDTRFQIHVPFLVLTYTCVDVEVWKSCRSRGDSGREGGFGKRGTGIGRQKKNKGREKRVGEWGIGGEKGGRSECDHWD